MTHMLHKRGFTLLEAIVTVGIISMIGLAVVVMERSVVVNSKVVQSELISSQQIRRVFNGFVSEIRGASQSASGGYTIETAGTSSFTFYSNIDNDSAIERIRYFVSTSTLWLGITKPTGTVYDPATEVVAPIVFDVVNPTSSPVFVYYDGNYDGVTASSTDPLPSPVNIPSIRMAKIILTVNPNGVRAPFIETYVTQASFRNIKDNY